jgi:hypothetical protein
MTIASQFGDREATDCREGDVGKHSTTCEVDHEIDGRRLMSAATFHKWKLGAARDKNIRLRSSLAILPELLLKVVLRTIEQLVGPNGPAEDKKQPSSRKTIPPPSEEMSRFDLRHLPAKPMVILGLALLPVIGWVDSITGVYISFTVFYLPPMALVAWYGGKWLGILSALEGAIVWLGVDYFDVPSLPILVHVWNALTRFAVFAIVSLFVRETSLQLASLEQRIGRRTRDEDFHRVLPLCPHCMRVRREQGDWTHIEGFLKEEMKLEFTHTICPDCAEEREGKKPTQEAQRTEG